MVRAPFFVDSTPFYLFYVTSTIFYFFNDNLESRNGGREALWSYLKWGRDARHLVSKTPPTPPRFDREVKEREGEGEGVAGPTCLPLPVSL